MRECLTHMIVQNQTRSHRILKPYFEYDNGSCTPLWPGVEAPCTHTVLSQLAQPAFNIADYFLSSPLPPATPHQGTGAREVEIVTEDSIQS